MLLPAVLTSKVCVCVTGAVPHSSLLLDRSLRNKGGILTVLSDVPVAVPSIDVWLLQIMLQLHC